MRAFPIDSVVKQLDASYLRIPQPFIHAHIKPLTDLFSRSPIITSATAQLVVKYPICVPASLLIRLILQASTCSYLQTHFIPRRSHHRLRPTRTPRNNLRHERWCRPHRHQCTHSATPRFLQHAVDIHYAFSATFSLSIRAHSSTIAPHSGRRPAPVKPCNGRCLVHTSAVRKDWWKLRSGHSRLR